MGRADPNSQCLRPTQAGVADNVCSEDRRQFALLTDHGKFPRFWHGIAAGFGPLGNSVVVRSSRE